MSCAPPVPRSPRPQKPTESFAIGADGNSGGCKGEDPTYHVLEGPPGPTPGSELNAYSLDPIDTTEIFGDARIEHPREDRDQPQSGAVGGSGQERVYFELEDPHSSSLIKHRTTNRNPTYESVKSNTAAYWSEGLGPDQPKLAIAQPPVGSEAVGESGLASGPSPPSATAGPGYLELQTMPSPSE